MEIILKEKIKIGEQETDAITLDLDSMTGSSIIKAESLARRLGDNTPAIVYSQKYQTVIASMASGIKYDDLLELPAPVFMDILEAVNSFLFARG